MSHMTPSEIVSELDKHIVGQDAAKRAVAIALRNRWRRQQVAEPLRSEITPKNILMIGPTGVGKTEIARRLARLAEAPFIKVEATKFTEVGYVGRDVDTIIRDLVGGRDQADARGARRARCATARPMPPRSAFSTCCCRRHAKSAFTTCSRPTRPRGRNSARCCARARLDDKEVEVEIALMAPQMEIMAPPGMEDLTSQIQGMFQQLGGARRKVKKMTVAEAMQALTDEEAAQARQRRRDQGEGARRRRAERHRVPGRDRQDREPAGNPRRRRLAAGRAARPPAAGRRHHGVDQVRDDPHRSHPVHRLGRVSPGQALGPHPRAAGPVSRSAWSSRRFRSPISSRS